ncbi:unnamed protein product [Prorocentrum cordatum]|uniref:Phosphatidylserine decarboxylase n=1 Tax=Prorocentrum cordatum TaxID=2364126 RepID=A0ABN9U9W4_9DINO|nr:unnamed protein product [Polarella glacialis]
MTLKVSVIAADELLRLVDGHRLVQLRLRWHDYHRVHSPVDGRIASVDAFVKDELFPGSEAMTVFAIEACLGTVKLMCIGEWSVQSFVLHQRSVRGGQVRKMDELGHFDAGSQVLLVLPRGADVLLRGGERLFPGDPVATGPAAVCQGSTGG